jgi:type VI secretion system protein ImpB
MAKDQSVAPQERVNITYKPATGDAQAEVELPLKMLFIGDYTGRADERPLEDRKPVNVDKDNFQQVLAEHDLALTMTVPNTLTTPGEGEPAGEMSVNLKFKKLGDFSPDAVAEQVPELKKLLELRAALTALKGPLGNVPAFRKKIQSLLGDIDARDKLMKELGLGDGTAKGEG